MQDRGYSFSQYGPTLAGEWHFYFFLKPNKWLRKEPEWTRPLWAYRMGRILPALGTNQIAGFVEYRPLTNCEKNNYTLLDGLTYNTRGCFASCAVFFSNLERSLLPTIILILRILILVCEIHPIRSQLCILSIA